MGMRFNTFGEWVEPTHLCSYDGADPSGADTGGVGGFDNGGYGGGPAGETAAANAANEANNSSSIDPSITTTAQQLSQGLYAGSAMVGIMGGFISNSPVAIAGGVLSGMAAVNNGVHSGAFSAIAHDVNVTNGAGYTSGSLGTAGYGTSTEGFDSTNGIAGGVTASDLMSAPNAIVVAPSGATMIAYSPPSGGMVMQPMDSLDPNWAANQAAANNSWGGGG